MLYTRGIELAFKRYVISPTMRPPQGGFFIWGLNNEQYFQIQRLYNRG